MIIKELSMRKSDDDQRGSLNRTMIEEVAEGLSVGKLHNDQRIISV